MIDGSPLHRALRPLATTVMRLGFQFEVRGQAHVPRSGPVLLVSNHVSMLDAPFIGAALPRALHFLAKEDLFGVPLFGRLIRALNAVPIANSASARGALEAGRRLLEEGRALVIFPEGKRGAEGELQEGRPGAGVLAVRSGAPVVPLYVSGTGRALPVGSYVPRPAKVCVTFGSALRFTPGNRQERYREATKEMMRAIARLRDAAPGCVVDAPR